MPTLQVVVSAKKSQGSLAKGWSGLTGLIRHVDVGGATDGVWNVSVVSQSTLEEKIFDCETSPMGNLIGCIDQSLIGKLGHPPPKGKEEPSTYRHNGFYCALDGLYH